MDEKTAADAPALVVVTPFGHGTHLSSWPFRCGRTAVFFCSCSAATNPHVLCRTQRPPLPCTAVALFLSLSRFIRFDTWYSFAGDARSSSIGAVRAACAVVKKIV